MWNKILDTKDVKKYTSGSEVLTLNLFYEHKELGNFYVFSDDSLVPYMRKAIIDVIIENERLGLKRDEIIQMLQSVMDNIKANNGHDAYAIANTIKGRVKDEWSYLHSNALAASAFILSENEDIWTFDQSEAEKKINIWKKDANMYAFFLSKAQRDIEILITGLEKITSDVSKVVDLQITEVKTLAEKLSN